MTKQTIELSEEDMDIISAVRGVIRKKNIRDTISFIIQDYGKLESYSKLIEQKRGEVKSRQRKS